MWANTIHQGPLYSAWWSMSGEYLKPEAGWRLNNCQCPKGTGSHRNGTIW